MDAVFGRYFIGFLRTGCRGGRGSLYGSVLGFGRRFGYRLGLFCRLGAFGNKASVSISAPVFGQWVVNVGHRYVGTLVNILERGRPVNIFATNALRAAGDVNYPFYVGLVVMWSVAVGLGYLFGIPWGGGSGGMWVAFLLDENIRGAIFVRRWYSMKWASKSFIR